MAQRNKRVPVESSDVFIGTGVHAPSIVRAERSSAEGSAEALSQFLKVGGYALAVKGMADFKDDAAVAQAEQATGKQRDTLNKAYGYNASWDGINAEDDARRAALEIDERLRGLDFENMTEEELNKVMDEEFSKRFAGAEQTPAYLRVLAPLVKEYSDNKIADHRAMQIQNIKDMQAAKVMRNIEGRARDSGGDYDYEYAATKSNDLRDGPAKNEFYLSLLENYAIENGRPDVLENAPDFYPSGQPTPTSLPKNARRVRNATSEARNVKKARETALTKAVEKAQKERIRGASQEIATAIIENNPNSEQMLKRFARLPGVTGSQILTLRSGFASVRDDIEEHAGDPTEVSLLYTSIYTDGAGYAQAEQAYRDGVFGSGRAGLAGLLAAYKTIDITTGGNGSWLTEADRTNMNMLKAMANPQLEGPVGKFDPKMSQIQSSAVFDYREARQSGTSAEDAMAKTYEATRQTVESNKSVGDGPDSEKAPKELIGYYLSGSTGDTLFRQQMFTKGITLEQIEGLALEPDDELKILNILYPTH